MFQCLTIQHLFRFGKQQQQHKNHPRAKFTPEEDEELTRLVGVKGDSDWKAIAEAMQSRTVRQCKERWINYLSPTLDKSPWKEEEDQLLNEKYKELGSKWRLIAQSFPNRTEISVKNRMKKLLRKQAKNERFVKEFLASMQNATDVSPELLEMTKNQLLNPNAKPQQPQNTVSQKEEVQEQPVKQQTDIFDLFESSPFDVFQNTESASGFDFGESEYF